MAGGGGWRLKCLKEGVHDGATYLNSLMALKGHSFFRLQFRKVPVMSSLHLTHDGFSPVLNWPGDLTLTLTVSTCTHGLFPRSPVSSLCVCDIKVFQNVIKSVSALFPRVVMNPPLIKRGKSIALLGLLFTDVNQSLAQRVALLVSHDCH